MTASELLPALRSLGLTVGRDGERLTVRPASRLTPEVRAKIVEHRDDLLALVDVEDGTAADPFAEMDAAILRQMAAGAWRHAAVSLPPWMPRWGYIPLLVGPGAAPGGGGR